MARRRRSIRWYPSPVDDQHRVVYPADPSVLLWVPTRSVFKLDNGEWVKIDDPLLPGYVLYGSWAGWQRVVELLGVPLVVFDGQPRCLMPDEVEHLRQQEDQDEWLLDVFFVEGQRVAVKDNALTSWSGFSGRFNEMFAINGGYWAKVTLDVFGRHMSVRLPVDYLVSL